MNLFTLERMSWVLQPCPSLRQLKWPVRVRQQNIWLSIHQITLQQLKNIPHVLSIHFYCISFSNDFLRAVLPFCMKAYNILKFHFHVDLKFRTLLSNVTLINQLMQLASSHCTYHLPCKTHLISLANVLCVSFSPMFTIDTPCFLTKGCEFTCQI